MADDIRQELVKLLPRLRRFAYTLSGSLDEADDLVQAACLRALSRIEQYEAGTRLDSWMFRIVQTIWIDRIRKTARRKTSNDLETIEMIAYDARIAEQIEARDELQHVRQEVAKLPEEQRLVLAMVAVDGLSYQEAAEALRIPIGTVMSRLARARKKLAAALDPTPTMPPVQQRMA